MLRDFNSSSICMTDFHLSKKFYFIYFKTYIRPYCPARGLCHQSEQLFRGVNLACSGVRIGDSLQVASRWMPDPRFPSSALHYNEMININHFTCQCTMKHWQTYIMEVFFSGNWWYLFTGVHSVSIRMLWGEKSDILTILLIVDVRKSKTCFFIYVVKRFWLFVVSSHADFYVFTFVFVSVMIWFSLILFSNRNILCRCVNFKTTALARTRHDN